MTGPEFAAHHGDPTHWTAADYEVEQNLAHIDQPYDPHRTAFTISARWCAQQATHALAAGDTDAANEYRDGMNRLIDGINQPTQDQHTTAA